MAERLRVGILGLGRSWSRWARALNALQEQIEPTAVHDPRASRAALAARELGCSVAEGAVALLERDDVDAVLQLNTAWYGLWPIELACRVNKPVFCAAPLSRDDDNADALLERVRSAGLPVMIALPGTVAPARLVLDRILRETAGPIKMIRAERGLLHSNGLTARDLLTGMPMLDLLVELQSIQSAPTLFVSGRASPGDRLVSILMLSDKAETGQVSVWTNNSQRMPTRLQVIAEHGVATVAGGNRVVWREHNSKTVHLHQARDSALSLLERFVKGVREKTPLWPGLDQVHQALRVVRTAARSLLECCVYTLSQGINLSELSRIGGNT